MIENEYKEVCMAKVQWFEHPVTTVTPPGSVRLWSKALFKPFGSASFIPITRIKESVLLVDLQLKVNQFLL